MALLKAFVCQLVLFGLYKLFLEQVVVDHIVPDELTRNCVVGFVIFMCFGIQLYTEKVEDDLAENEEDVKMKSKSRQSTGAKKLESTVAKKLESTVAKKLESTVAKKLESTGAKKLESTGMPVANETYTKSVGSETSSYLMNTKKQTEPTEMCNEKQHSQIGQVIDFKENSAVPSAEGVTKNSHHGMFAEFSSNVPDKISSAVKTSHESETKTFPALNGFSDINVSPDSEEEGIVIDQFVCKESFKAAEKLTTVDAVIFTTEPQHATEAINESENFTSNAVNTTSTKDFSPMIVEPEQLITVKSEEFCTKPAPATESVNDFEKLTSNAVNNTSAKDLDCGQMVDESELLITIKSEVHTIKLNMTEAGVESEDIISNGMENSSTQDFNSNQMIESEQLIKIETIDKENLPEALVDSNHSASNGVKISSNPDLDYKSVIDESESQVINGTVMESSNMIDEIPSNKSKENEINSKKDGKEIEDGRHIILTHASERDAYSTDITESLPSAQHLESKSSVSIKTANKERTVNENNLETSTVEDKAVPTKTKIPVSESVYVSNYPVDISFIYACH